MEKKYSAKYFRDSMPDWKKKKDPWIAQVFYRPLSFYISAFCANRGISANSVSYFSMLVAIAACACYCMSCHTIHIIGAIIVNIWLLLDCVDGNIARSVKAQPFGEFADAGSSYLLISFIYITMGYALYNEGGLLFEKGEVIILLMAGFATSFDSFARFLYHKYKDGLKSLKEKYPNAVSLDNLNQTKPSKIPSLRDRIGEAIGIGGFLPAFILLFTCLGMAEFIIYYIFCYNLLKCCYVMYKTITLAIKITNKIDAE